MKDKIKETLGKFQQTTDNKIKTYYSGNIFTKEEILRNNINIKHFTQVLKLSDLNKEIQNRIDFWSRPKSKNIKVSPEEITIKTERMFEIQKRMVIEELKSIKKRLKG